MKKILLLISTSGYSPETVEHAFNIAEKESAELIACFIIDAEIPDAVSSWMIYLGFMGDEPSGDYRTVILQEYELRAKEMLDEIEKSARTRHINIESLIVEGHLLEQAIKIARERKVDLIVTNIPQRMDFERLLHRSVIEDLIKMSPCPVTVVGK